MLDRLDDLIRRFVAVFLLPLMNVVALGSILYICTKQNIGDIFTSTNLSNFVAYILGFFSGVLENGFGPIITFAENHSKEIQSISFFVALFILISLIVLMYVIERLVYVL